MNIKLFVTKVLTKVGNALGLAAIREQVVEIKMLTARINIKQILALKQIGSLADVEFKVFSQFGDDGIIQYLIHKTAIGKGSRRFIEFGVETYEESNTRFLLMNDNWQGLIIDGSQKNIDLVRSSNSFWKYDLTAIAAFIDADNINDLFVQNGFSGEIGLLSIDIDGNDYWIWEHINTVNPIIVIAEYNSVFGSKHAVTIPYDATFIRGEAHYSNLYWGCSIAALNKLAENKGYAFIGCNSAGNNAYFVRLDRMNGLSKLTLEEGFVESKFRESRDASGQLSYLSGSSRLKEISSLPIFDVDVGQITTIIKLYGCE